VLSGDLRFAVNQETLDSRKKRDTKQPQWNGVRMQPASYRQLAVVEVI